MSLENVKSNIVTVNVSGVTRVLNLEQVLFAVVGSTTSAVHVDQITPVAFNIEGDFRNVIAGAGGSGMNAGPIFGAFTDVSSKVPIVINFSKLNRFVDASTLTFASDGTVAAFTYTLLESPVDVIGATGHSLQDVGIVSVNKYGGFVAAPVQNAAATANSGGTVPDNTYFLKIVARNAQGHTTGSNETSIVVAGTVPDTSTLTANWSASVGATSYDIYIGTSSGAENVVFTGATGTTHTFTALPVTSGTVPTTNTAQILNTQELINTKNVVYQVPSGTNWSTVFMDADTVIYVESLQDLVGG